METLNLYEGDFITMDVMGTQTENIWIIREKNADYLLEGKKIVEFLLTIQRVMVKGLKPPNDIQEDDGKLFAHY